MSAEPKLSQAEYGRRGARRRWGPERVVRIDALDPRIRTAIVALIQADEAARVNEEAVEVSDDSPTAQEDRRVRVDHPTAA